MKKTYFIFLFFLLASFVFISSVKAQENNSYQTILTWQAENLYPADYQGKALATEGSTLHVSVELLKNGKIVDLSGIPIKWYLEKNFFDGGTGLKEIVFTASLPQGASHILKTSLQIDGKIINGFLEIPISESDLVIEVNTPHNRVKPNSSALFTAVPYFFNVSSISDLSFSWAVQDQPVPSETDYKLQVQFGEPKSEAQREIKISSSINEGVLNTIKKILTIRVE